MRDIQIGRSVIVSARHGKAEPIEQAEGGLDINRRLVEEGRRAASALGSQIQHYRFIPDRIFVSPALRAKETLELILENLDQSGKLNLREKVQVVFGLFEWSNMEPATQDLGMLYHLDAYLEKYGKEVAEFERDRMQDINNALGNKPIGDDEKLLYVSHGWIANTCLYPFTTPTQQDGLREIGLPEAHALVWDRVNLLGVLGPEGIVLPDSLTRNPQLSRVR